MDANAINFAPVLQQLFGAHGIDASIDGEWVVVRSRPHARASAAVVQETRHGESLVVVQLEVRVFFGFGRMIVESFMGFGAGREEAVRDALGAFVDGAFHVIVAACFDVATDQVERETWTIGGVDRVVTIGPAQCRGMGQEPSRFDTGWFAQLRNRIVRHDLPPGTHWVRLYVAHSDRRLTECEVLLDNDAWEPLAAEARDIDWPAGDGFSSHRIFLIIRGGRDVADLAGMIHELRDRDDGEIAQALVGSGLAAPREAQMAVALIPIAFGRVVLKKLVQNLPDEMWLVDSSNKPRRAIRLSDEPLFAAATRLAEDAVDHGALTQEQFSAIALRGCEMNAVNNALHGGEKAQDLVLSPPMVALPGEQFAAAPPRAAAAQTVGPVPAPAPRRPWWRFWA